MPSQYQFPDPNQADDDGLIAVGGNLSIDFLIAAYSQGLFPWFNEGEPILWWSPNPRMLLFPKDFKCSKSLTQIIRSNKFQVKADEQFKEVIQQCATISRKGQKGSWISDDMVDAYTNLHLHGLAHSIEIYQDGLLTGGLYGVSIGKAFFGESMFHLVRDASKVALYYLVQLMLKWEMHFIDVQQSTSHLRSMGAKDITRENFMKMLKESLRDPSIRGKWTFDFQ